VDRHESDDRGASEIDIAISPGRLRLAQDLGPDDFVLGREASIRPRLVNLL